MRKFLRSAAFAGAGLALSAIAAPVLLAGGAGAATTTTPVVKSVTLTNTSSGTTVVATVGELVIVDLTGGTVHWTEPATAPVASAAAPVLVRESGSTSSNGSATATFEVARSGTASIRATGTPACPGATGTVCTPYVVLWQAAVDVPVVDPPPVA